MATEQPTSKTCTRCGQNLPIEEFYRKRNGREPKCRTCVQELRKERRAEKPPLECNVEGCAGEVHSKGMCDAHYRKALKAANPPEPPSNPCACGCGGFTRSTYVTGHHRKVDGAPAPVPAKPVDQRIRESSTVSRSGCWEWNLSLDGDGYGSIKVAGRARRAARTSYEVFVDDIPEGMVVHQTCQNRACVNPDHLETITNRDQFARGKSDPLKNFAAYYERRRAATHCPNGHPWDEENTRHTGVQRVCRACLREGMRTRREDDDFRAAERERERELYENNREYILARKRDANKRRYAVAKAEGRCAYGGGRCKEPSSGRFVMCDYHRELSAARNWGIRKHPMEEIYAVRGIEVCWICGVEFTEDNRFCNDHLIPRSLGGPDEPWNLAPACSTCNCRRNNLPLNLTIPYAEYPNEATKDFPEEFRSYLIA